MLAGACMCHSELTTSAVLEATWKGSQDSTHSTDEEAKAQRRDMLSRDTQQLSNDETDVTLPHAPQKSGPSVPGPQGLAFPAEE